MITTIIANQDKDVGHPGDPPIFIFLPNKKLLKRMILKAINFNSPDEIK